MKTLQCTNTQGRIALFPGSFDPFTRGHESIVRRALPLFDQIVIAIGINPDKAGFMTMEQRKEWIETIFTNEPKVKVVIYTGLTVDVARQHNAQFLLRGVRMIQDFETEMHMAEVNRQLSGLETVLLYTLPEDSHVSSTIVRELARYGEDVTSFLPSGAPLDLLPTTKNTLK
ncbi:MAG: pantetheine-phosphate adenylyltransferase [Muribaculaceae bacterium]|nr:pantetheine-phosphate adenylyltransferase [Muribaculaceae bacterium]